MTFLENYVLFEDPEMNRIFIEKVLPQDKSNFMSIDEYIRMVAKEEAQERFVKNLLKEFDFPVEKVASLADVSVEFVNEIKADMETK